jgi:hypothetical protein
VTVPFLAMVFDQCTDPICDQTGYLDFDVYNELQPVFNGACVVVGTGSVCVWGCGCE